jgi:hypothetical protein
MRRSKRETLDPMIAGMVCNAYKIEGSSMADVTLYPWEPNAASLRQRARSAS